MAKPDVLPKQGYWLELAVEPESPTTQHIFCGEANIKGAVSPNNGKPLTQVLSLDLRDPRIGLTGLPVSRLPLLMSFTCGIITSAPFYYRVSNESVELLEFSDRDVGDDFPFDGYRITFPACPLKLREVPRDYHRCMEWFENECSDEPDSADPHEDLYEMLFDDLQGRLHLRQLGGCPYLVQIFNNWRCIGCSGVMPLLAVISDTTSTSGTFTGNSALQTTFSFCARCRIVAAEVLCD